MRLRLSAGEYAPTYPRDRPSLAQFGSYLIFAFSIINLILIQFSVLSLKLEFSLCKKRLK